MLHYLRDTQKGALDHLERPSFYDRTEAMVLDAVTVRNLELLEPLFAGESKESTLLSVLDETATGMGGRLLRRRLLRPCLDRRDRNASGCCREFAPSDDPTDGIAEAARRHSRSRAAAGQVTLGTASPRDMLALGRSLDVMPKLKRHAGRAPRGSRD